MDTIEYDPETYRSPCCQAHDLFVQAWSGVGGSCEYGMSGAHLEHWQTIGCETHQHYGFRVKRVGRYCPHDCEWSQQPVDEEAEVL